MVGDSAKLNSINAYRNVLYDSKRILGRKFSDEKLQQYLKTWPFTLNCDQLDNPKYEVTLKDKDKTKKTYYP